MNKRIKKKKIMQALKKQFLLNKKEIYKIDEIINLNDGLLIQAHIMDKGELK